MTAKTTAQRVKETHARKIAAGLKLVRNLWAYEEDIPAIRQAAAKITAKRARQTPPKEPKT